MADTQRLQELQLLDVGVHRPGHTESVDDVIGHEFRRGIARLAVMVVVVGLPGLYVVRENLRHLVPIFAVAVHHVDDVISDHAPEPPQLVSLMRDVLADIGRRHHADLDVVGVASGRLGG